MDPEQFRLRIEDHILTVVDLADDPERLDRLSKIQKLLFESGASSVTYHTFLSPMKNVKSIQELVTSIANLISLGDRIIFIQQSGGKIDCRILAFDSNSDEGITIEKRGT